MQTQESNTNNLVGIYNFGDFLSMPLEKPLPALAGFLFEGQTGMLAGRFGIGKTLLSTQMTLCLACGKEFLGRTVARPYKVAFIDCENGPNEIQNRVKKQIDALKLGPDEMTLIRDNCFYANARDIGGSLYGLQISKSKADPGVQKLKEFLNDYKAEIVILDNLGRLLPGDLEKAEDVKGFFEAIQAVKEVCPSVKIWIFLHHIKKPNDHGEKISLFHSPYEFLSQMRGSGRLLDFSEMRYALAEESFGDTNFLVLNGITRSADVVPTVLEKHEDSLTFQVVSDKRFLMESLFEKRPKAEELVNAIKNAFPNSFHFTDVTKLLDSQGKPFVRGTVDSTLKLGLANGLFFKAENGTYTIAGSLY
jgi:hypothetical protein